MRVKRALLVAAALASLAPGPAGAARLVFYGWGIRDAAWVRDHWREMERMPFDGTGISVYADIDGAERRNFGSDVFGPRAWRPEAVRAAVADLRAPAWTRFTDNFLPVCMSGPDVDQGFAWTDARRWRTIRGSWKTALWLARRGGLRGLILDPEHYGVRLLAWPVMRERSAAEFDAYRTLVRARGRELGAVAAHAFPGAVVLALYGHTLVLEPSRHGRLATAEYGLYPAFLDGFLEGTAGRLTLVDGYEFAYGFRTRDQFEAARREITEDGLTLTAVPDRYRAAVRVGFGLWLDRGAPERWFPADPAANWFTPDGLRDALRHALAVTDGYVWLYAQHPRFFPPRDLPDVYVQAIAEARGLPAG